MRLEPRTLIKALMEPLITRISGFGLPRENHQHSIPNALGSRERVRFPPYLTLPQGPKADIPIAFVQKALVPVCKNSSFPLHASAFTRILLRVER